MRVLFYSTESFVTDKPTGAGKYNQQHLRQMTEHGHQCTMFSLLVENAADRPKVLQDFVSRGYQVESEELALLYIDRIIGESFDVITFTHKPFKRISISEKLKFIFLGNSFFNSKKSSIANRRRNFLGMIWASFRHNKGLKRKILLIDKWLYYYWIEPYHQAIVTYYKSKNRELNPDFIIMDGWVERMAIAQDFSKVTELKKPKVIPMVSTSIMTNFGSMALFSEKQTIFKETELKNIYLEMDGFLVLSKYLKNYLLRKSGMNLNCQLVYPLIENDQKYLSYKKSIASKKYVTLINASNFKGLPIFLALAKKFPDVDFMAVTTWGNMKKEQFEELENLPNVRIQKPLTPVDPIYEMTKILLAPSLWDEAFGMVIVEAMLRAIPVLGSDVGGLSEAKLGTDFLLPVNAYKGINDDVPLQEIGPWAEALNKLLKSDAYYDKLSKESQKAAREFIGENQGKLLIDGFITKSLKPDINTRLNQKVEVVV
ncbi:glycosyltransferase family 4 protein [Aquimarina pacifica]|uniref:glycosyltransferase family 4 protein n=1 Tax=Aquimarina pacifica TaxID=1296415 RepID=UPI000470CB4E|nr:glycosyltransferase family 4 protein [Aquimarina pacifica]